MPAGDVPVRSSARFLVFGAPLIEADEVAEVVACLESGWLGRGPRCARFEEQLAEYLGGEMHAVAVASCTAALHLSLIVSGVRPGDEVVTSPLTFCATVNTILHAGAVPVLADVDPTSMNLDPAAVEAAITPRTRAIIPVHLAGRPCAMDRLRGIAEGHGLTIIEDCAHAIEARCAGRSAGTLGDFGCFSFYATKNVVTGEGGMVVTRDAAKAARMRRLAAHGLSSDAWQRLSQGEYRHYVVEEAGFKYNMTDIQAALGLHQLARVERSWGRRRQIWQAYEQQLGDLPLTLPAPVAPGDRHALHLFTVLVDEPRAGISRDAFLSGMTAQGIGVGVHYLSLPEYPYYQRRLGWRPEAFPRAMALGRQTASLPLSAKLGDDDVADVVRAVRRVLRVG